MRYRIINNDYVFGITDTKCKKGYRFSKYDKLNIFSKFNIENVSSLSNNSFIIFPIILKKRHVEILNSKDEIVVKMFIEIIYNKYIKQIKFMQKNNIKTVKWFNCNI